MYHIVGMFGGVNVRQIAELKIVGKWIDFDHKNTIYKLKFGWLKFGKAWTVRHIFPNFPAAKHSRLTVSHSSLCH